uniref:RRM domain-containing protein n=2 Tax=Rhizochromulina marina TaxID=1034831 RepID=A0A7S2RBD6_9STRA|mmetsp:Transcript_13747/g.40138  ORF Transcript_13747/g.40138 Transcript_13747/m.40138 type:complete len:719 (+) Transcript_13747:305-2461(+)
MAEPSPEGGGAPQHRVLNQRQPTPGDDNNLFVGDLARDITEEELKDAFEPHGRVVEVLVKRDRLTHRNLGYGFVRMGSHAEACLAKESMHGREVAGRRVRVGWAMKNSTLVVKDLDPGLSEEDLLNAFARFGPLDLDQSGVRPAEPCSEEEEAGGSTALQAVFKFTQRTHAESAKQNLSGMMLASSSAPLRVDWAGASSPDKGLGLRRPSVSFHSTVVVSLDASESPLHIPFTRKDLDECFATFGLLARLRLRPSPVTLQGTRSRGGSQGEARTKQPLVAAAAVGELAEVIVPREGGRKDEGGNEEEEEEEEASSAEVQTGNTVEDLLARKEDDRGNGSNRSLDTLDTTSTSRESSFSLAPPPPGSAATSSQTKEDEASVDAAEAGQGGRHSEKQDPGAAEAATVEDAMSPLTPPTTQQDLTPDHLQRRTTIDVAWVSFAASPEGEDQARAALEALSGHRLNGTKLLLRTVPERRKESSGHGGKRGGKGGKAGKESRRAREGPSGRHRQQHGNGGGGASVTPHMQPPDSYHRHMPAMMAPVPPRGMTPQPMASFRGAPPMHPYFLAMYPTPDYRMDPSPPMTGVVSPPRGGGGRSAGGAGGGGVRVRSNSGGGSVAGSALPHTSGGMVYYTTSAGYPYPFGGGLVPAPPAGAGFPPAGYPPSYGSQPGAVVPGQQQPHPSPQQQHHHHHYMMRMPMGMGQEDQDQQGGLQSDYGADYY